ncbi:outer membrane lipoprotein chaperone LolA [Gayadomonas joobiniege]|uniref:outer membrane lipoprotein chaperone LolA n=1 Tax=Gayadomonas joobiniege TaxID=1234606 RepID=UPI0003727CFE|nr:outer membrane lipoprotein chaperone LolA [Gayadomonas joobiniege]
MKFIVVLFSLLFVLPVAAQNSQQDSSASSAQAVSEQLANKLAALQGFSATFSQQVVDSENSVVQQGSGQLDIVQPNKFRWHLEQPDESLLLSDGRYVWFYDPFVEQASVYDYDYMLSANPILLLLQPASQAWQNYQVKKMSDERFKIISQDQQSQIAWLEIQFAGQQLAELVLQDRQMQTSHYTFSNFELRQTNQYQPGYFSFDLPDGVELDDQRQ